MGCCGSNTKLQTELALKHLEKYSKLKSKLEQFLFKEDPKERMNPKKLFDIVIKSSNEISDYEKELNKLKINKLNNINISDELIEAIEEDINKLNEYHKILRELLANSDKVDNNKENKIINEKININNKEDSSILSSEINNKKENIYFKKYIRRNKKGILNKNKKNDNIFSDYKGITQARLNFISNYEFFDDEENNKKNDLLKTTDNLPLDLNNEDLNLIFELDDGKKTLIHAKPEEKFLNVIKRLSEKEKNCDTNIENLKFFDEDKDISDKIINGEIIKDFNLTDFHLIQVKFKDKNNLIEN